MQMYTGTRLTTVTHRRLLSRFFLREGGRLYTGCLTFPRCDLFSFGIGTDEFEILLGLYKL